MFSKASLPAATKLGQGNKFTGVCLSTWGGVCLTQIFRGGCLLQIFLGGSVPNFRGGSEIFFSFFFSIYSPPPKNSSGMHTLPSSPTPLPPETVSAWPVCILLECILVHSFCLRGGGMCMPGPMSLQRG